MENAILKFNGGKLALLCSKCSVIIKVGSQFTAEEWAFAKREIKTLEPLICKTCKPE